MSFNVFSQLFGSREGHVLNTAVDTALPGVASLVPVGSAVVSVLDAIPHPVGTTATVTVNHPDGTTTVQDIDLVGKVIATIDPAFITQVDTVIDGVINKVLSKLPDGGELASLSDGYVNGYIDAKLEGFGVSAPAVVANPVPNAPAV